MPAAVQPLRRPPFAKYQEYVTTLHALACKPPSGADWNTRVVAALNGQASIELRKVVPLDVRREYGAFFTGTKLGKKLLSRCKKPKADSIFYDPTCGMGDLLLAAATRLPLKPTLTGTLKFWGEHLAGTDLHREFIAGTKTRLALLARQRHGYSENLPNKYAKYFPYIRVSNSLKRQSEFRRATHLLMNPPFGFADVSPKCEWAGGRVSEAATFIITALKKARHDTEVFAILPEVLRSGSFYANWRAQVSELAEVYLVEPFGVFDDNADVDVFILRLIRRQQDEKTNLKRWPKARKTQPITVADFFDVHVGRVVPFRDKKNGPESPYIHPRCVPAWSVMRKFDEKRKFKGLLYDPPFVVIRRTSRPGHPYRATATVISGNRKVAVENHLIVCEPKDKTLKSCMQLMRQLKTQTANVFLNKRIRCRHLTVGAVGGIPLRHFHI